jgi:hypothetical protein
VFFGCPPGFCLPTFALGEGGGRPGSPSGDPEIDIWGISGTQRIFRVVSVLDQNQTTAATNQAHDSTERPKTVLLWVLSGLSLFAPRFEELLLLTPPEPPLAVQKRCPSQTGGPISALGEGGVDLEGRSGYQDTHFTDINKKITEIYIILYIIHMCFWIYSHDFIVASV